MLTTVINAIQETEMKLKLLLAKCNVCIGSIDIEDVECTNLNCDNCFDVRKVKNELVYHQYMHRIICMIIERQSWLCLLENPNIEITAKFP